MNQERAEQHHDVVASLSTVEQVVLICRDVMYGGKKDDLSAAINGPEYEKFLHMIFPTPEEASDAVASLSVLENRVRRRLSLEDLPEDIRRQIAPYQRLPEGERKRMVTAYLSTIQSRLQS